MEGWLVAAIALVALVGVGLMAIRARREVARITAATDGAPGEDPVARIRALHERVDRAEQAGSAARRDFDTVVEALPVGVIAVDDGLRIKSANAAAHAFLDTEPPALVGRTLIEAFLDTEVEGVARAALAPGSGSSTGEVVLGRADGRKLAIRARRSATGAWLILEDVSELRRLQQIRTEFIDNLSHELRTPLTTVSLLAETLTREAEAAGDAVPPRMRDRIDKIEVETGHLVQMVSELLDLSRIESGGALGAVDIIDVGRVVTHSVERLRLFADRQGVALRLDVGDGIPPVRGDPDRLGQVVINLVHNAVKFSPDGGDVTVSVRPVGAEVVVAIADHGVGIPTAAQVRIFERFYKVDRARVRGETGGTGLGLAISRHIIEQHGGRIWVESSEGVGSTFSFSLPIADPPT